MIKRRELLTRAQRISQRRTRMARMAATVKPPENAVCGGTTSGVAIEKEAPAKPGKGASTKDERQWMEAIVRYGCIACHVDGVPPGPTAVHHILRGGQRIGHKHTLPLCDPGHHQNGAEFGRVSRHPWKARFEAKYGTELELLTRLQVTLRLQPDGSYAP